MINCEFNLCIYNKDNKCIFQKININSLGICDNCMLPNIDKEIVEKSKIELLKEFDKKRG